MSLYTNLTGTTSHLLARWRNFWAATLNLLHLKRKSNGVPLYLDIHTPPTPFSGFSGESGESGPKTAGNGGTKGESTPIPDSARARNPHAESVSEVSGCQSPDPTVQIGQLNRQQRRQQEAWERARRKHDKWVEPQGPQPVKVTRAHGHTKQRTDSVPAASPDPEEKLLFDEDVHYRESELWGQFSFRDTILEQLERYWVYLDRMKKHDHDSYEFYKRLGATIVPPIHWFLHRGTEYKRELFKAIDKQWQHPELSPWWKENRPTFGCVTFGINKETEKDELEYRDAEHPQMRLWIPKFLYFTKYRTPPPNVQPTTNGDVYGMTIWWDRPHDPNPKLRDKYKGGVPEQYAVYISADGSDIHVLPQHEIEYLPIRRKKPSHGYKRGNTFTIPHHTWRIPGYYTRWAKKLGTTPNILLSSIFVDAAVAVEQSAYSMVRIAVHNKDLTAVFGVDVKRLPYFFQDRDITLTESGARKRAFHIVRAHERKSGAAVKFHFRGEKEFNWAGYRVEITVPGRDHFMLQEIEMGMDDIQSADLRRKDYKTQKELAEKLTGLISEGRGGIKR